MFFYKGQMGKYYFPLLKDTLNAQLHYAVFDEKGTEVLRLLQKPSGVLFDNKKANETDSTEGYEWNQLGIGGVLTIRRTKTKMVTILQ